jgi:Flp pilus assembly pilin Flp
MVVAMGQHWIEPEPPRASPRLDDERRRSRQRGQGLVEYSLLLALVAAIAIVGLTFLGGGIDSVLSDVGNAFGPPGPAATATPTTQVATPQPTKTPKPKKTPKPTRPPKTPKPTKAPKTPKPKVSRAPRG